MNDATEKLQSVSPFHEFLNIHLEEEGENHAVCSIPLEDHLFHAGGVLHGGISYALADTAVAMALMARLGSEPSFFTIEGKMNYLASVPRGEEGRVRARADLEHVGSSTAVARTDVTGPAGTRIAIGTFTYAIRGRSE